MERNLWIERRAYQLWELADRPNGLSLNFWLKAEIEHDAGQICVLSNGSCPYQTVQPTEAGRHVSICKRCGGTCRYRASEMNKAA